jgi:hypothetical protein
VASRASSNERVGRIPGRRRASIVFPDPEPPDPRLLRLEHAFDLTGLRRLSRAEWVDLEKAKGRLCACGCAEPIRIAKRHRRVGIPTYRHGHHAGGMTKEVRAIRAEGGMTSGEVARLLGIGLTTLRRLDGVAYQVPERAGGRRIRVFGTAEVRRIRKWLAAQKRRP